MSDEACCGLIRSLHNGLQLSYDPEIDAMSLYRGPPSWSGYEVADNWSIIVHVPHRGSHKPTELEIIGINGWLSSGLVDYHEESDILTFGKDADSATIVAENCDLVAYWRPDEHYPDMLECVAVDLRNGLKHLAPVIHPASLTVLTADNQPK